MEYSDAYQRLLREAAEELDRRHPPTNKRARSRTWLCGSRASRSPTQRVRDVLPTSESAAIDIDGVAHYTKMSRQNLTPILRGLVAQGIVGRTKRAPAERRPGRVQTVYHYWRVTRA
jgi:CRP-like cAMP-binding protein